MQETWYTFLLHNLDALGINLLIHIYLALSATAIAILVGVPLGIWIMSYPKLRSPILGITSIFQTIPSLALLAFLVPILGIGVRPTIVTLTVYALLPIVRNTFTGLSGVPPESIEAARGLGFTRWQRMYMVEIPLAMPIIVAGIRTATAMTVGITTIAAFIGAGGLGVFITQGLSLDSTELILLGAIPAALLALALDFIIGNIEASLSRRQRQALKLKKTRITIILVIIFIILYLVARFAIYPLFTNKKETITVGSKNFTEQYILSDMMADLISAKTNLRVKLKLNLGTTAILQDALINGDVDLYPEYTGTAYLVVLKYKKLISATKTYDIVKQQYEKRYNLTWLKPFGFSNSETLAVRERFAKQHGLTNLSQLARISSQLTIAAPSEFLKRPDGFPGLKKAYGFKFKKILLMEPNLMYEAIKDNDVQVIEVFTTDGRIVAYNLKPLNDNKHFYPPYDAAPVIRNATLKAHPEIATALAPLAGFIDQKTMQHLNYLVDVKKISPAQVAHDFLKQKKLLQ